MQIHLTYINVFFKPCMTYVLELQRLWEGSPWPGMYVYVSLIIQVNYKVNCTGCGNISVEYIYFVIANPLFEITRHYWALSCLSIVITDNLGCWASPSYFYYWNSMTGVTCKEENVRYFGWPGFTYFVKRSYFRFVPVFMLRYFCYFPVLQGNVTTAICGEQRLSGGDEQHGRPYAGIRNRQDLRYIW